jgi:hypothetical protein
MEATGSRQVQRVSREVMVSCGISCSKDGIPCSKVGVIGKLLQYIIHFRILKSLSHILIMFELFLHIIFILLSSILLLLF